MEKENITKDETQSVPYWLEKCTKSIYIKNLKKFQRNNKYRGEYTMVNDTGEFALNKKKKKHINCELEEFNNVKHNSINRTNSNTVINAPDLPIKSPLKKNKNLNGQSNSSIEYLCTTPSILGSKKKKICSEAKQIEKFHQSSNTVRNDSEVPIKSLKKKKKKRNKNLNDQGNPCNGIDLCTVASTFGKSDPLVSVNKEKKKICSEVSQVGKFHRSPVFKNLELNTKRKGKNIKDYSNAVRKNSETCKLNGKRSKSENFSEFFQEEAKSSKIDWNKDCFIKDSTNRRYLHRKFGNNDKLNLRNCEIESKAEVRDFVRTKLIESKRDQHSQIGTENHKELNMHGFSVVLQPEIDNEKQKYQLSKRQIINSKNEDDIHDDVESQPQTLNIELTRKRVSDVNNICNSAKRRKNYKDKGIKIRENQKRKENNTKQSYGDQILEGQSKANVTLNLSKKNRRQRKKSAKPRTYSNSANFNHKTKNKQQQKISIRKIIKYSSINIFKNVAIMGTNDEIVSTNDYLLKNPRSFTTTNACIPPLNVNNIEDFKSNQHDFKNCMTSGYNTNSASELELHEDTPKSDSEKNSFKDKKLLSGSSSDQNCKSDTVSEFVLHEDDMNSDDSKNNSSGSSSDENCNGDSVSELVFPEVYTNSEDYKNNSFIEKKLLSPCSKQVVLTIDNSNSHLGETLSSNNVSNAVTTNDDDNTDEVLKNSNNKLLDLTNTELHQNNEANSIKSPKDSFKCSINPFFHLPSKKYKQFYSSTQKENIKTETSYNHALPSQNLPSEENDQNHSTALDTKFYIFKNSEENKTYALFPESLFSNDDHSKIVEAQVFDTSPNETVTRFKYLFVKVNSGNVDAKQSFHNNSSSSISIGNQMKGENEISMLNLLDGMKIENETNKLNLLDPISNELKIENDTNKLNVQSGISNRMKTENETNKLNVHTGISNLMKIEDETSRLDLRTGVSPDLKETLVNEEKVLPISSSGTSNEKPTVFNFTEEGYTIITKFQRRNSKDSTPNYKQTKIDDYMTPKKEN